MIFSFDVLTGQLDTALIVKVEVFDISPDFDAETDPVSLIEYFDAKKIEDVVSPSDYFI